MVMRAMIFLNSCLISQFILCLLDRLCVALVPRGWVPGHCLLVTQPRSGSTLLLAALSGDPRVWCKGEILNEHFLRYGSVASSSMWRRELHTRACMSRFQAVCVNAFRAMLTSIPLVKTQVYKVFLYHVIQSTGSSQSDNGNHIIVPLERILETNPSLTLVHKNSFFLYLRNKNK